MTDLDKIFEQYPALKDLSLTELHARKAFNSLIMRVGNHTPQRIKEFNEINDILLVVINSRLDQTKP